jgi:hypothetical protein
MSQANAAARKRRAGGASLSDSGPAPQMQRGGAPEPPKAGLTLPQVISLVDKRLITLETFMRDQQQGPSAVHSAVVPSSSSNSLTDELAEEFNAKFEMLAGEVEALKDIVLKLQAYTMEVNKTLYEERIQMLSSDVKAPGDITFDLSECDE